MIKHDFLVDTPEDLQKWIKYSTKSTRAWKDPDHLPALLNSALRNLEKARKAWEDIIKKYPEIGRAHALDALSYANTWRQENHVAWTDIICAIIKATQESGPRSNNSSGYRGVSWHKAHGVAKGGWRALIHVDNKPIEQGEFIIKEEAAVAYDKAALFHFGTNAYLNFPMYSTLHYAWYGNTKLSPTNIRKKGPMSTNTSGFKGVCRHRDKWLAQVYLKGRTIYAGRFTKKEDAALAVDLCAIRQSLSGSYLNFPLFSSLHYAWYKEWNPK